VALRDSVHFSIPSMNDGKGSDLVPNVVWATEAVTSCCQASNIVSPPRDRSLAPLMQTRNMSWKISSKPCP